MTVRNGDTVIFGTPPVIHTWAAAGGKKEAEGPLADAFDLLFPDTTCGSSKWEQAESILQQKCVERCLKKANLDPDQIDLTFAGDLQAQCTASNYAMRGLGVPFAGLYGACSTMAEALCLSAAFAGAGYSERTLAMTSSHFCAAERQFRTPLDYGAKRTPTAQWTATAAGCCVVGAQSAGPYITHTTRGRIVDLGVTDAANMGAAMAPAAHDTLTALFRDTATTPRDYDLIVTGDLGYLGHALLTELFRRDGVELGDNCTDCGILLYDRVKQDMHAGGSGCGCSAAVLNGYLLHGLRTGRWQRVIFAPTGALLSPTSSFQGESVPGICHAVVLSHTKEAV